MAEKFFSFATTIVSTTWIVVFVTQKILFTTQIIVSIVKKLFLVMEKIFSITKVNGFTGLPCPAMPD
jgi:hypothetical protein